MEGKQGKQKKTPGVCIRLDPRCHFLLQLLDEFHVLLLDRLTLRVDGGVVRH